MAIEPSSSLATSITTSWPAARSLGSENPSTIHARPGVGGATGGVPTAGPDGTAATARERICAPAPTSPPRAGEARSQVATTPNPCVPSSHVPMSWTSVLGPATTRRSASPSSSDRAARRLGRWSVGMESAQATLGAATGVSVAGSRRVRSFPRMEATARSGTNARFRSGGVHPDEGSDRHRATKSGRDDGASARASGQPDDGEDGEAFQGPLPMRFTRATSVGLSGSSSRTFTQFCVKLAT